MIIGISGRLGSGKDTVGKIIQELTTPKPYRNVQDEFGRDERDVKGNYVLYPEKSSWEVRKFAKKLKQVCSILTGIPEADFEKQEVKDGFLGEEWDWITSMNTVTGEVYKRQQHTVRSLLQRVGTDAMRDVIHPNVWVNALMADYKYMIYDLAYLPKGETMEHVLELYRTTGMIPVNNNGAVELVKPSSDQISKWIITDCRFSNEAEAIKSRGGLLIRVNRGTPDKNAHISETALDNFPFDYTITNNGTIEELSEKVKEFITKFNIK